VSLSLASKESCTGPASSGISMIRPISVLSTAERGSRLREPTNSVCRSKINDLAWRLERGGLPSGRLVVPGRGTELGIGFDSLADSQRIRSAVVDDDDLWLLAPCPCLVFNVR